MRFDLLTLATILGLSAALVWCIHVYRTSPGARLRTFSGLAIVLGATIMLGPVARTVAALADVGEVAGDVVTILIAGLAIGVSAVGLRALPRMLTQLTTVEIMVHSLSSRLDSKTVSALRLTPRELEVIEVMVSGVIDDAGIAEALTISPATAGTHVRNVMVKANVRDRRDLALLRGA